MLSEEKAIIEVRKLRDANKRNSLGKSIETVLNFITKLQKENEEKDKQIDLMVEWIEKHTKYYDEDGCYCEVEKEICEKDIECKNCIKQYFERKSEE